MTVSGFAAVPAGNYNITGRRIYRTVVGATTVSYLFVAEIPVATASYAATGKDGLRSWERRSAPSLGGFRRPRPSPAL